MNMLFYTAPCTITLLDDQSTVRGITVTVKLIVIKIICPLGYRS